MRKHFGNSVVVAMLILVIACSSSSSPSSPAAPAAAVPPAAAKSLKIIGAANSYIVVGDTAQFTAMATMTDGAVADVTAVAAWTTSDASIFAVAPGGKVTALKVGSADIRATFQNVSDKDYTTVQPFLLFKAYGTVSDAPPGFATLAGARVDISGSTVLNAATDGNGDYSFPPLKGGVYTIKVSRDGYESLAKSVTLTRDARTDFALFPVPPAGATARCKDKSWSFSQDKPAACSKNGGVAYWACPGPFC